MINAYRFDKATKQQQIIKIVKSCGIDAFDIDDDGNIKINGATIIPGPVCVCIIESQGCVEFVAIMDEKSLAEEIKKATLR